MVLSKSCVCLSVIAMLKYGKVSRSVKSTLQYSKFVLYVMPAVVMRAAAAASRVDVCGAQGWQGDRHTSTCLLDCFVRFE
jgi:hypothetical protein